MFVTMFAAKYAIKSISRRPKKNLGAILAVSLGVMLLIGVQVGSAGLEQAFAHDWYNSAGEVDLGIYDPVQVFMPENTINKIEDLNLDIEIISPRVERFMPFYASGQFDPSIYTKGITPTDVNSFGKFYDLDGVILDPSIVLSPGKIVVNDLLADSLNVNIGDKIISSFSDVGNGTAVPLNFEVSAIIDNQMGIGLESNYGGEKRAYVAIDEFQSILIPELQNYMTDIAIKLNGVDRTIEALDIEEQTYPGKSKVDNGLTKLEEALSTDSSLRVYSSRSNIAESVKDEMSNITGVLNLFVVMLTSTALLLIVNVNSISLDDRRYQTAVLRAMGSNKAQIFRVFLIESLIIGVLGAIIGSILGIFYGQYFISATIADIFGFSNASELVIPTEMVTSAVIMGVALAILTTVIPAWWAASRSVTNELRGIEEEKDGERGKKAMVFGTVFTLVGLFSAQNVGEFWTKEAWSNFDNQVNIMLGLGLTIFGLGLLLSFVINEKLALNMSAFAFYGLAMFSLYVTIDWVEEGNANNWLAVILMFVVIGLVMLASVNFELIMRLMNGFLFLFAGSRAISQVSTKSMIGKKGRLTMVFAIFTIVLILTVFVASAAESIKTSNVDAYDVRSKGVDIVVNINVPSDDAVDYIKSVEGVDYVFSFRSTMGPMFFNHPIDSEYFDSSSDVGFRRIVEVPEEMINPDNDWNSENALPFGFFNVKEELGAYDYKTGMDETEQVSLSSDILDDFYAGRTFEYEAEVMHGDELVETRHETSEMIIADMFEFMGNGFYFQSNDPSDPIIETVQVGAAFTMMGDWGLVSGAYLVTPAMASRMAMFDHIDQPNIFLVKTSAGYQDVDKNNEIAANIESVLNNLQDSESLSGSTGVLYGAYSRVVQHEVYLFWKTESDVWVFLATFSTLGLIIAAIGMVIIAIRSVAERTREIGMMRAIGFSRSKVVWSVGLELLFISGLGLLVGIVNGLILTDAFTKSWLEVPAAYPIPQLLLYCGLVFGISLIAGILPGIRASRVPPSQALRYTG